MDKTVIAEDGKMDGKEVVKGKNHRFLPFYYGKRGDFVEKALGDFMAKVVKIFGRGIDNAAGREYNNNII